MAIFSKKTETEDAKVETDASKNTKPSAPSSVKSTAGLRAVLVQPRISEKSSALANMGKYVFKVSNKANKIEIKKAVETVYKVRVTQVNIVNVKGKAKNFGNIAGNTSKFKKAIVSLKEGDKIEGSEVA